LAPISTPSGLEAPQEEGGSTDQRYGKEWQADAHREAGYRRVRDGKSGEEDASPRQCRKKRRPLTAVVCSDAVMANRVIRKKKFEGDRPHRGQAKKDAYLESPPSARSNDPKDQPDGGKDVYRRGVNL
jgi:hypothetical protein